MAFSYSINGVFDVDQRWDELPGNGSNYCVPAAITNWMYYYAAHGKPSAIAFPRTVPHNIPLNISAMGGYMDTDASDGTYFSDAVDGLCDWLDDHNIPAFVYYRRATDNQNITYVSLRNRLQLGGNIVVCRGRYKKDGDEFERIGGHAMTLVALRRTDDNVITMGVHNPNNDGDISSQAATHLQEEVVTEKRRNIEGDHVTILRWGAGSVNPPYLCIDGCIAIQPLFAVSNVTAGSLTLYLSNFETDKINRKDFPLPFQGEIGDLVLNPSDLYASVIAKNSGEVWTLDLSEGSWSKIVGITNARLITYGGINQQLFVLQGSELLAFDESSKQVGHIHVDDDIDALSFDHEHNRLIALSAKSKSLIAFSTKLTFLEKKSVPEISGSGRLNLSVGSRDNTAIISREGLSQVTRVSLATKSSAKIANVDVQSRQTTGAIHATAKGRLFLNEAGKIATFESNGKRKVGFILDGLACGSFLKVARSSYPQDDKSTKNNAWRN